MDLIWLGIAVGAASYLTASSKLFYPLRLRVETRKELATWRRDRIMNPSRISRFRAGFWTWLYDLVSCPYCTSHWFAMGAVAIYRPKAVDMVPVLDYVVSIMILVGIAMATVAVIRYDMRKEV